MVFGWGKKKPEKNHEEITDKKQISLNDIPKTVSSVLNLRKDKTLTEIKSLRDATEPLIKELANIGKTLEKDNLDVDEIDKHLRIIVVRGKKQVIDMIKKDVIELPKISTIDDAEKINGILTQTLKKLGDVLGRQTRVIHVFAKKYAEKLKEILAQMNSNHSEIKQLIKNYHDSKIMSDEILELMNTVTSCENDIKHKNQRISELKKDSESLNAKVNSLKESIDKIKSSTGYSKFQKLKQSLDELHLEKPKIKSQIDSQFTKISRPLGRYEYVSSDKEQKNLLTKLLEDPIHVLNSKNKDLIIVILENVRKGILSGSISVKDVDKSMSQITETTEMLDSFIHIIDEYLEKIHNVENQINEFDRSGLAKLEHDLEKIQNNKDDDEQKIVTFENELNQTKLRIPNLLSSLEDKLKKFSSTDYTLINPSQN